MLIQEKDKLLSINHTFKIEIQYQVKAGLSEVKVEYNQKWIKQSNNKFHDYSQKVVETKQKCTKVTSREDEKNKWEIEKEKKSLNRKQQIMIQDKSREVGQKQKERGRLYQCTICQDEFKNDKGLRIHKARNHRQGEEEKK